MCPLYERSAAELSCALARQLELGQLRPRDLHAALTYLVFHLGEFGVDDVALIGLARRLGLLASLGASLSLLRIGVHLLAELLRRLRERLRLGVDGRLVVGLHRAFGVLERGFDLRFFVRPEFFAIFLERLSYRVDQRVELVARRHGLELPLVLG